LSKSNDNNNTSTGSPTSDLPIELCERLWWLLKFKRIALSRLNKTIESSSQE
jgi:hypothetical protein